VRQEAGNQRQDARDKRQDVRGNAPNAERLACSSLPTPYSLLPAARRRQAGFTLIELAIVLIVVGLVLGLAAGLVGGLLKDMKVTKGKEMTNAAFDAVVSFVASNKRLPCITGFCALAGAGDEFTPILPNQRDPWEQAFNYIFDQNLTNSAASGGDVCARRTTNLSVLRCDNNTDQNTPCTTSQTISNVAYIVWSNGPNYNNQALNNGTLAVIASQGTTAATTVRINVPGTPLIPAGSNLEYDDIPKWITIDELRTKAGCLGAPLQILNNELPYGYVNTAYAAATYASGGVSYGVANQNYRWCVQTNPAVAPAALVFRNTAGTDITATVLSTDCLSYAEASWPQTTTVVINGTPNASGTFALTFFVRDNQDPAGTNDNIAQKAFVLTINPQ
jgi:prepilin-type N-terminal cleavage/methylation domain-containing protein